MSFWDYTLPWKAIPNMAKDVKKAWKGEGKNRHDSFVGAIGKYADPIGAAMGDDWMKFFHEKIPREVNRALEPVGEFHRDNLDPIYMAGGKNTDWGKAITDMGVNKGGDWSSIITAGVVGAGAIGGGAGGGSGGGGFENPYANMDWSNPQTYTRFGQPQQGQQQAQPQPDPMADYERKRREREERERAIKLAEAIRASSMGRGFA